ISQGDSSMLTANDHPAHVLAFKRIILPRFFSRLSAYLVPGDHGKDYAVHYGADPDLVHFCPIPVDVKRFRRQAAEARESDFAAIRSKYRIPDKRILLFSGKLISRKRPLD